MLTFIIILFVAGAVLAGRAMARGSTPTALRELAGMAVRKARVALGAYSLKNLTTAMVDDIIAAGVVSLTTTYIPNDVVVGLNAADHDRFRNLLAAISREVREIVHARVDADATLTLPGGSLALAIVRDDSAAAGAVIVRPGMRQAAVPAPAATRTERMPSRTERMSATTNEMETDRADATWALLFIEDGDRRSVPLIDTATIGRDATAAIRIVDRAVSREHARLRPDGDGVTVEDLHSLNGTFVNGMRVSATRAREGDELRFGGDTPKVILQRGPISRT